MPASRGPLAGSPTSASSLGALIAVLCWRTSSQRFNQQSEMPCDAKPSVTTATHFSQIHPPGQATSFRATPCDVPQKEQTEGERRVACTLPCWRLGPRLGADRGEQLVGGTQLLTRLQPAGTVQLDTDFSAPCRRIRDVVGRMDVCPANA